MADVRHENDPPEGLPAAVISRVIIHVDGSPGAGKTTFAELRPRIAAISACSYPKTSCSTNTVRSSGVSVSSTTSMASDTASARSAPSAASAPVASGSGSHGPT